MAMEEEMHSTLLKQSALAALKLAADKPWAHVSVHAVAREADVSLDFIYDIDGKAGLLAEIDRVFDRAMGVGLEPLPAEASEHHRRERLAEVMMQRFDAMERHRQAVAHIQDYLNANAAELAKAAIRRHKTAKWALAAADLDDGGIPLRSLGLAASFLRVMGVWLEDTAPNDSTMAAIDRDLRTYADWLGDLNGITNKVRDFFNDLSGGFEKGFSGKADYPSGGTDDGYDHDLDGRRKTETSQSDDDLAKPPPPL